MKLYVPAIITEDKSSGYESLKQKEEDHNPKCLNQRRSVHFALTLVFSETVSLVCVAVAGSTVQPNGFGMGPGLH